MEDTLALAFGFRQHLFELARLFSASWLGVVVANGLAAGVLG